MSMSQPFGLGHSISTHHCCCLLELSLCLVSPNVALGLLDRQNSFMCDEQYVKSAKRCVKDTVCPS